jgi:2'-5' RNA ligase
MARDRPERPEAPPLRLFAAVDIPPRVQDAVDRIVAPWKERFPDARWVKPENRHVTVKFLGRTSPRLVERVNGACRAAADRIRPFRVRADGMGVFPSPGRARVLWVGLRDREGGFRALAAALDRELERDFPPEKRAFTAHLTVARFNPPQRLTEHVEAMADVRVEAEPFRVTSLTLYRSHLSPKGARYEPLERFALRG